MKDVFKGLVAGSLLGMAAVGAQAAPTFYTDKALFDAAVAGMTVTTTDFDASPVGALSDGATITDIMFNYAGTLGTVSDLSIEDFPPTTSGPNYLGTTDGGVLLSGDNLDLSFAAANAIGMFLITDAELDPTCSGAVIICANEIALEGGGIGGGVDVAAPHSTLGSGFSVMFVGIVDPMATFTSAQLSSDLCPGCFTFNIDDIVTARLTTTPPPVDAPEPPIWALALLGMAGLTVRRVREGKAPKSSRS